MVLCLHSIEHNEERMNSLDTQFQRLSAVDGERTKQVRMGIVLILLAGICLTANAQTNEWVWMSGNGNGYYSYGTLGVPAPGNVPPGSIGANSWTDKSGNFWLFGGTSANTYNNLWEFSPTTNEWGWVSGGGNIDLSCMGGCGFPGVYGTLGVPASGNVPGSRSGAVSWTDKSGNLWLFGGGGWDSKNVPGILNDLWEFNPSTSEWTWMGGSSTVGQPGVDGTLGVFAAGNIPGSRSGAVGWVDSNGDFWLFGGGGNDVWKYDPSKNEWAWMGGSSTVQLGVYGTLGTAAAGNVPGSRSNSASWVDVSGNVWFFGGNGVDAIGGNYGYLNDLWKYNPSTQEWAWMGGSNTVGTGWGQPGVYGTLGVPASGNAPGGRESSFSWIDKNGNFWLFGGLGVDSMGVRGYLNDLWEFSISGGGWTWMGGSSTVPNSGELEGQPGSYGAWRVPAPGNIPSGRYAGVSWTDKTGNLWLFSGGGAYASDLWEYLLSPPPVISQAATPTFSVPGGGYTSPQTIELSDSTPGTTIYYTTDGTSPSATSTVYSAAITVSTSETVTAIATASGYENSNLATATYDFPAAMPFFNLPSGSYSLANVAIFDATAGATIHYTIDGTAPTANSAVYSSPIAVTSSETIKAIAVAQGYLDSAVSSASYTIASSVGTTGDWTWVSGSSNDNQSGIYGTQGTPAAGNIPGSRYGAVSWIDKNGNLWLFGGSGQDSTSYGWGELNDLWKFNPLNKDWTWISGSSSVGSNDGQSGVYGTLGTSAAGNVPGGRDSAVSWIDKNGNLWLFGGWGIDSNSTRGYLNDLWEFTPSTKTWTWMGGSSTVPCKGCQQPGAYGTLGTPAIGNIPGGREQAVSWVDSNGIFWLFGGGGGTSDTTFGVLNDLWEFNPSSKEWTWISGSSTIGSGSGQSGVYGTLGMPAAKNVPGGRESLVSWTDSNGNFWLFGGDGIDSTGYWGNLNDVWEFNPSTSLWTWMGGNKIGDGFPGVYGTMGVPSATNVPGQRDGSVGWTDKSGNFWLFGGAGAGANSSYGYLNDLWEFSPITNEWTWMGGNSTILCEWCGLPGVYGTLGVPAAGNSPGGRYGAVSWIDNKGIPWLFGGQSLFTVLSSSDVLNYNDLWEYTPAATLSPTATPTFNVPTGTYTSNQTVTISDATTGATIYFTIDGTVPTTASAKYTGPITVSSNETLNAIATANGYSQSVVATATYTITPPAATPTFSETAGTYTSNQTVTISDATAGAIIYYTTDATTPTTSSSVYGAPITIASTETIKAIATASGYTASPVATATYTINPPAATPTFSPSAGTYTAVQTITISDTTASAAIYYTTDGTTPTASSTKYTGAITVSATETIQAIATAAGYSPSALATAAYTINLPPPSFAIAGTSITVAPGATTGNTSTITLTPSGGFTGAVNLKCAITPTATNDPATCSIPTSVTISSSAIQTTTLTVNTTAATTSLNQIRQLFWSSAGGTALALLLFIGLPKQCRKWKTMLGMMALLVILAGSMVACGGGGTGGGGGGQSNPGTTAGIYTVTITGTSGTISETGTVTLTVQ